MLHVQPLLSLPSPAGLPFACLSYHHANELDQQRNKERLAGDASVVAEDSLAAVKTQCMIRSGAECDNQIETSKHRKG